MVGRDLSLHAGCLRDGGLDHGYALTVHQAQGLTCERALLPLQICPSSLETGTLSHGPPSGDRELQREILTEYDARLSGCARRAATSGGAVSSL